MKPKILFISTLNLACNPRLYKEIMLAKEEGYDFEVICFEFNNWSYEINKELLKTLGSNPVHLIQGNRKPFFPWAYSVIKEQSYRKFGKITPLRGRVLSQAVTRRSDQLITRINRLEGPFDLVIGHNPGALYPAYYAAKKFGCKCGFDVEDYHPGEGENKQVQHLTKNLMNWLLPEMDYVTFAAPLMGEIHADDIGEKGGNWHIVLNLFKKAQFQYSPIVETGPLRLVWFSQNVNYKRGLEQLVPALAKFDGKIRLTLIGNKKEPFYSEYVKNNKYITYVEPMEQAKLNRKVCEFDVGLAIEQGKDYNNVIALSNKLITYFQAGLFVLASDTPGQKRFFEDYPQHGIAVPLQSEHMTTALQKLLDRQVQIRQKKQERFLKASQLDWESESRKLIQIWQNTIFTR